MASNKTTGHDVSRRRFMGLAGLAGVGAIGTALAPDGVRLERQTTTSAQSANHDHGSETVAQASTSKKELTAEEMDAMHEAGVKAFPAETNGKGGQPLEYEMDGAEIRGQGPQFFLVGGREVEALRDDVGHDYPLSAVRQA